VEEPFETGRVGSSAMAYKRGPMRAERMTGMSRHVIPLVLDPRSPPRSSSSNARRRFFSQRLPS
jgi:hypothetical protein